MLRDFRRSFEYYFANPPELVFEMARWWSGQDAQARYGVIALLSICAIYTFFYFRPAIGSFLSVFFPYSWINTHRMRSLFRAFEEKGRLVKILNACLSGGGVRVIIGHENPDPELKGMALVTASYPVEGEVSFGLGVMGSTRMEYARVVALVDQVARTVARTLQDLHS
jgi:hypothetical protein